MNGDEIPVDSQVQEAVRKLDADTLRDIKEQAILRQQFLDSMIRDAISRCWVLVGWLATLASSLAIALGAQLAAEELNPRLLVIIAYGIVVTLGIIVYLILNNFIFVGWVGPGEEPANLLRKSVMDPLSEMDDKLEQRWILACHIVSIQRDIEYNEGILESVLKPYRVAIKSLLSAIIISLVLMIILLAI